MLDAPKVSKEEISQQLNGINVCKVCRLRIIGTRYDNHMVDETFVREGPHCCVCLGILEGCTLTALAKKVAEQIKASAYETSTFQLHFVLPQCVLLREAAVKAHVEKGRDTPSRGEYPPLKIVAKFFLAKLIKKFSDKEPDQWSKLYIRFNFKYAANMKEISSLDTLLREHQVSETIEKNRGKSSANMYSPESVRKVVHKISNSSIMNYISSPPHALPEPCDCEFSVQHNSIFIGGRFNKYARTLRVTAEYIDGVRREEMSVAALLGEPLKGYTRGKDTKFHSTGKDDADVRILGTGQPFAIEVVDPKRITITDEQMVKLEAEINASTNMISVQHIQFVKKRASDIMAKGDEESKTYMAKLWCPEMVSDDSLNSLNSMKEIKLEQKTPIRELHVLGKREVVTKCRKIHKVELKRTDDPQYYELNVVVSNGTFVPEFVHGDLGRTEPSLRTILGVPIDLVDVDLISADLNWPPDVDKTTS